MFKIKKTERIAIHGHRGSRGTHPENTIPSFQEALDAGADFFEIDLHLSADNVPIVFHDPYLSDRSCREPQGQLVKKPIPVRSLTVAELSQFDCGNVAQPRFPEQKLMRNLRIPTLASVFEWMSQDGNGIGINIEVKMESTQTTPMPDPVFFAKQVVDLIHQYKMTGRALVQSFDFRVLVEAKKLDPQLTLSCLFEKQSQFIEEAKKLGVAAIGPFYELLTPQLIQEAHQAGLEVLPWTVNDEESWNRLIRMGVDGIITDYPRALETFLVSIGK